MRKSSLLTPLIAAGTLMIPTAAWAQAAEGEAAPAPAPAVTEAPPPAAETPPPAAAEAAPVETAQIEEAPPEEAPPPLPPPAAETSTEMAAPAAEAAPEEEGGGVPGWFRFDSDGLALQLWAGASHDVGGISIASDIYVDSGYFAEFDIGVELPIGENVLLIPMVGIGFDWSAMRATTLIAPQLFGYFDFDPVYIELWSQVFFGSVFAEPGYSPVDDGMDVAFVENSELAANYWYNRLFILFNATENLSIGPQIEPTIALNDAAKSGDGALASLPVGGRVNVGYGENNTLGLFLGYETVSDAQREHAQLDSEGMDDGTHTDAIVGRFTFVRTW